MILNYSHYCHTKQKNYTDSFKSEILKKNIYNTFMNITLYVQREVPSFILKRNNQWIDGENEKKNNTNIRGDPSACASSKSVHLKWYIIL